MQNNRDLWVILPKNAGSIEPVQLATYADQQGTLDGKPITVHHLVATGLCPDAACQTCRPTGWAGHAGARNIDRFHCPDNN
jgi:hypothetical protein